MTPAKEQLIRSTIAGCRNYYITCTGGGDQGGHGSAAAHQAWKLHAKHGESKGRYEVLPSLQLNDTLSNYEDLLNGYMSFFGYIQNIGGAGNVPTDAQAYIAAKTKEINQTV